MALNIYVQLRANGNLITGDVSHSSMGGTDVSSDHIEANALFHEASTTAGSDPTRARSTQSLGPLVFTKRSDRATPLLFRAWAENQVIDAIVKVFSPDPQTGQAQLWQVFHAKNARISAIRTEMLNNHAPENATMPVLERVTLAYQRILVANIPFNTQWESA